MDLNYSNLNLFPTTIHCFDIKEFDKIQNELINDAYKLREIEPIGKILSNVGGWQSDSFFVDSNKNSLHDVLLSVITNIPNIKRGTKTNSTAWININPSGAFNSKHNHPNCDFSGVLWIKCPKDSGNIIFLIRAFVKSDAGVKWRMARADQTKEPLTFFFYDFL